ncbi:MAG: hypothetical protein K2P66_00270, partial [Lachnospiraceae bacterium]|nr:hypothetical protein [Lachnospiraceae bacterium]
MNFIRIERKIEWTEMAAKRGKIGLVKRDGEIVWYSHSWVKKLIRVSANRILAEMSDEEIEQVETEFAKRLQAYNERIVPYEEWRKCMGYAMKEYPEVLNAFLAAHKEENAEYYEEICDEMSKIMQDGDRSNGSVDSSLSSSKRALIVDSVEKIT